MTLRRAFVPLAALALPACIFDQETYDDPHRSLAETAIAAMPGLSIGVTSADPAAIAVELRYDETRTKTCAQLDARAAASLANAPMVVSERGNYEVYAAGYQLPSHPCVYPVFSITKLADTTAAELVVRDPGVITRCDLGDLLAPVPAALLVPDRAWKLVAGTRATVRWPTLDHTHDVHADLQSQKTGKRVAVTLAFPSDGTLAFDVPLDVGWSWLRLYTADHPLTCTGGVTGTRQARPWLQEFEIVAAPPVAP
jgi:hypothetical protein